MLPIVLTILLAAAFVLADPSGDHAARRTFSMDVSFAPMPSKSPQDSYEDGLQQRQKTAPVTSLDFGSGSWTPQAPSMLEHKGPPPFMPDDANSVEVPALGPMPTTVTTTAEPPEGLMAAAMPLMAGVKNMVGQAEKGAQQLLHLPAAGGKTPSENKANALVEAQTSQAKLRLQVAHKQAAELQAQLAKVQAQLKHKGHQLPVTQLPVTQQAVTSQASQTQVPVTQQPITQQAMQALPEQPKAKTMRQPQPTQQQQQQQQQQTTAQPAEAKPKEAASDADKAKLSACAWSKHAGKVSYGNAGGVMNAFSPEDAKTKCIELGKSKCKAITCSTAHHVSQDTACTVRAASVLQGSPVKETTYVPSAACFTLVGSSEAAGQKSRGGSSTTEPADTKLEKSSPAPEEAAQAQSKSSSSRPVQPKPTTTLSSREPVSTSHKSKTSSSEAVQSTQKTGAQGDDAARLKGLMAALRGSGSDKSTESKFAATPVIFTHSNQGNVLMLGSAIVAIAAVAAFAARYLRATSHSSAPLPYLLEDEAIE